MKGKRKFQNNDDDEDNDDTEHFSGVRKRLKGGSSAKGKKKVKGRRTR